MMMQGNPWDHSIPVTDEAIRAETSGYADLLADAYIEKLKSPEKQEEISEKLSGDIRSYFMSKPSDASPWGLARLFPGRLFFKDCPAEFINYWVELGWSPNQWYHSTTLSADGNLVAFTPLHMAVMHRRPDMIGPLLRAGADPFITSTQGLLAVHMVMAADLKRDGSQEGGLASSYVRAFLDNVREEDKKKLLAAYSNQGDALLSMAVSGGNVELVEYLLDTGLCDLEQQVQPGITPLHIAAYGGAKRKKYIRTKVLEATSPEQKERLMELVPFSERNLKKEECDALEKEWNKPNMLKILSLLVKKGANIHAKDSLGDLQPIHHAANSGDMDILNLLLEHGADLNSLALEGQATVIDILIKAHALCNVPLAEREISIEQLLLKGGRSHFVSADVVFKGLTTTRLELLALLAQLSNSSDPAIIAVRNGQLEVLAGLYNRDSWDKAFILELLYNLIVFAPLTQEAICEFILTKTEGSLDGHLMGNSLLHVLGVVNKDSPLLSPLLAHDANLLTAPDNYRGESVVSFFKAKEWKKLCAPYKVTQKPTATAAAGARVKALESASPAKTEAEELKALDLGNKFKEISDKISAVEASFAQIMMQESSSLKKGDLLDKNAKELEVIGKTLDLLEMELEDSDGWRHFRHLHNRHKELGLKYQQLIHPNTLKINGEKNHKLISNLTLKARLGELLKRWNDKNDDKEIQKIIAQIRCNLIDILESYADDCRIAYYLRQLLVHEGHDWVKDASLLIELAEKLVAATAEDLTKVLRETKCYQTRIYAPYFKKKQRPNFMDKNSEERTIVRFYEACENLAACLPYTESAIVSNEGIDRLELARLALYDLREILRSHTRWPHKHHEKMVRRLEEAVNSKELTTEFMSFVCAFGNETIHQANTLHIKGAIYEKISLAQMRNLSSLAQQLLEKGLSLEALQKSPITAPLAQVAASFGAVMISPPAANNEKMTPFVGQLSGKR